MTGNRDLDSAIERLRGYVDNGGLIHTASAYRTSDGRVHLIEFDDLRAVLDAAAESTHHPAPAEGLYGHRAILIQQARAHVDEWRRYDDTADLVDTLVQMANLLSEDAGRIDGPVSDGEVAAAHKIISIPGHLVARSVVRKALEAARKSGGTA